MKVIFNDVDDYCDLMTFKEWISAVKCGAFIDDDGFGYLATESEVSNIEIVPSQANAPDIPEWVTHIAWYNR